MAKKYVSLERLTEYDTLIKSEISKGDESTLSSAQSYSDTNLATAKTYADEAADAVKNDLLNGAGTAYDTLKELGDLIDDNTDAIDALETVATGKANAVHTHTVSEISDLAENYLPLTGGTVTGDVLITGDRDSKITLEDGYLGLHFGSNRISLSSEEQLIEMQTETEYMNIHRDGVQVNSKVFNYPNQSGTLALTSDLENLSADKVTVDHESMTQLCGFSTVQDQLTEIDRILDEDVLSKEFALTSDLDAKQDKCINNNVLYVGDTSLIGLDNNTVEVGSLDDNLVLKTVADRPQWTNDGETFKDLAIVDDITDLQNQKADSSSLANYLPLTGGTLTKNNGTIGLYPNSNDGTISEPSIEIANDSGDYANISPAAVDLSYGGTTVYLSAEESYLEIIGANNQSTALSPSALNIQNNEGSVNLSPSELQLQSDNVTVSLSPTNSQISVSYDDNNYASLFPEYLEINYNSNNVMINPEEGHISMTIDENTVSLTPQYITANGATLTFPTSSGTLALTSDIMSEADKKKLDCITFDDSTPQLTINNSICEIDMNDDAIYITADSGVDVRSGGLYVDGNEVATVDQIPDYITTGAQSGTTIGSCATAEGSNTTASGNCSHAEGHGTKALDTESHAEGLETTASNVAAHAEGGGTKALGGYSHAEGAGTTASAACSHAEGLETTASGEASHAEGSKTTVTNDATITAQVTSSVTAGAYGHAEGYGTVAYGNSSHAEGNGTTASGIYSHAEGAGTTASSDASHAEGGGTTASGYCSHAEGSGTTASGSSCHAEGFNTTASGLYSHAGGYGTIANSYQYAVGKYNADTTAPTSLTDKTAAAGIFIVGIGTSDTARSNGFRVNPAGKVYGVGTFSTNGADYAEYFEWLDGNPDNEDRRGRFVTLEGDKIRYATANDDYILGVVSTDPSVAGDMYSEDWHNRYLKDVFGSNIVDVVEVEETTNEYGEIIPAHTERRWVLNPDYDPDLQYVSREERPEWAAIGIVGKLVVVDDGTCQVNGYCYPNADGIATASQEKTNYRVMERLDDTHIRIFIR